MARNDATTIHVRWTVQTPLKIGPEGGSPEYDLPVQRILIEGEEQPYIPGSSLKGVIRSAIERELRGEGVAVCDPLDHGQSCGGKNSRLIQQLQRKGERKQLLDVIDGFCIACKLFGSPHYRGRVRFADAYPAKRRGMPEYHTAVRPGIAIDRRSGSVMGKALFQAEYVAPDSTFESIIIGRNLEDYELALLLRTLLRFNSRALRVGGLTNKGFGVLKVGILAIERYRFTLEGHSNQAGEIARRENEDIVEYLTRLEKWSNEQWSRFLLNIGKQHRPMTGPPTEEDVDSGPYVRVRKVRKTPRDVLVKSQSGWIRVFIIPRNGYSLHVGSGTSIVSGKRAGSHTVDALRACKGFDYAAEALPQGHLAVEDFAAVERFGKRGICVIPGSTLRGLFRSMLEFSFVPENDVVDACFVKASEYPSNVSEGHLHVYGIDRRIEYRQSCRNTDTPCVVCDIFGMAGQKKGLRGLVSVEDAVLLRGTPEIEEVPVGRGTFRGKVVVGSSEKDKRPVFRTTIRYENLDDIRLGLLILSTGVFSGEGIRIGRFKYRDLADEPLEFGRADVKITRLWTEDGRVYKGEELKKHLRELTKKVRDFYGERLRILGERKRTGRQGVITDE